MNFSVVRSSFERLYTQAQRKITSVIEQLKEGKIKPKRARDIGDTILTVEALDYAESTLGRNQVLKSRSRNMRADLETPRTTPTQTHH